MRKLIDRKISIPSLEGFSSSATGNVNFWKDYYEIDITGPGKYETGGYYVDIYKSHKVKKECDRPHKSVERYGYGQMFFGRFSLKEVKFVDVTVHYYDENGNLIQIREV